MREGGCLCGAQIPPRRRTAVERHMPLRDLPQNGLRADTPLRVFPADRFAITKGQPSEFHSSPHVTRSFCGQCGSPLTYRRANRPDTIDVMTCSLDAPDELPPTHHAWVSDKLAWDRIADDLPTHATTREADGET